MTIKIDKSSWSRAKFGDVVENTNRTIKNPIESGIDKFIGLEHLDSGELKIKRFGDTVDGVTFTKFVSPGQTLFGKRRAYQKKVAFAEFNAVCSGDILAFSAIPGLLAEEFLPFVVMSEGFFNRALSTSAGSLSPRTRWTDLAKFEFLLPPLDQQKEIAKVFWQFEKYTESLKELISDAMEIKQAFVRKKFDEFQQFDMMYLSKLISLEYGKSLTATSRIPGQYPVVGSTGIVGLHEEFLVEGPVIIVGRKGNAGNVFLIADDCFPIDTAYYVKMISDEVSQEFVFESLKVLDLPNLQESTAIPGLNRNRVYDLMIPVPPESIQEEFSVTLSKISDTILDFQKEMEAAERLKKKLLEALVGDET